MFIVHEAEIKGCESEFTDKDKNINLQFLCDHLYRRPGTWPVSHGWDDLCIVCSEPLLL